MCGSLARRSISAAVSRDLPMPGSPESNGLDLKGLHEALGLGIVIGIATSAHGADETMFGQVAIRLGGVLRTTIRVVSRARGRGASLTNPLIFRRRIRGKQDELRGVLIGCALASEAALLHYPEITFPRKRRPT